MADNDPRHLVAEALKSGEWKEKNDPRSGRKYYVHSKTRRSVWAEKFEKELAKSTGEPGKTSPRSVREERHEKARKRAEAEAQLKEKISTMEQNKIELEVDIARLKAPVEHETAQLNEMRRSLGDKKFSMQVVETEAVEKRKARDAELKQLLDKVRSLQGVVESERTYREAIDAKHRQLVVESMELKADVQKEEAAAESLRVSVRAAELKLNEARASLANQKLQALVREEMVTKAEEDLRLVAKKKQHLDDSIKRLESERVALREHAARMKKVVGHAAREGGNNAAIERLMDQYNAKMKEVASLSKRQVTEDDIVVAEHSTGKLRQLIAMAQRDRQTLVTASKLLLQECRRVSDGLADAVSRCSSLRTSLKTLRSNAFDGS